MFDSRDWLHETLTTNCASWSCDASLCPNMQREIPPRDLGLQTHAQSRQFCYTLRELHQLGLGKVVIGGISIS